MSGSRQTLATALVVAVAILVGCGPSDEDIAASVAAQLAIVQNQTVEAIATVGEGRGQRGEAEATITPMPSETPMPTVTPLPSDTPTITPIPSETPIPTIAPSPTETILTCEDIDETRKDMTDLQREAYYKDLAGRPIRFAGEVIEVYTNGRIQISGCGGLLSLVIQTLYEVPTEMAIELNKDQMVRGQGTIRKVEASLGLHLDIDVVSIE